MLFSTVESFQVFPVCVFRCPHSHDPSNGFNWIGHREFRSLSSHPELIFHDSVEQHRKDILDDKHKKFVAWKQIKIKRKEIIFPHSFHPFRYTRDFFLLQESRWSTTKTSDDCFYRIFVNNLLSWLFYLLHVVISSLRYPIQLNSRPSPTLYHHHLAVLVGYCLEDILPPFTMT